MAANNPAVEVRRYEEGFLHGKAFIIDRGTRGPCWFVELHLRRAGSEQRVEPRSVRPDTGRQVIDWFNEQWDKSVPYDLAGLYEARWDPHTPFDVFLRMLFEKYGNDLSETTRVQAWADEVPGRRGVARETHP